MFFRFIRACRRYKFTFALSTYGGLTLILRPNDTFENYEIKEECADFMSMFSKAIRIMKKYRKEGGF